MFEFMTRTLSFMLKAQATENSNNTCNSTETFDSFIQHSDHMITT